MPFPLSFGGGGIFAFVFCLYFRCTHRTHRAPRQNDVHSCREDVHIDPHRRTLCASRREYLQSQKQKQRQKRNLKVVKLLFKLFYLATVIQKTLSGGIAATDDKYDRLFYLRQHPANSLPRIIIAAAPNTNEQKDRDALKAFQLLADVEYRQPTISFTGFVSGFELYDKYVDCQCSSSSPINWFREMNVALVGLARLVSVDFMFIFPWTTTTNSLGLNEWNKQDSSHLYHDTAQLCFISHALNHTKVLPIAGTTIIATCGGFPVSTVFFFLRHLPFSHQLHVRFQVLVD